MERKKYQLVNAPEDSIEFRVSSGNEELFFLNKKAIAKFGISKARALNSEFETADWSKIIDALIVIRKEQAPILKTK